jgi:hypothetical protein
MADRNDEAISNAMIAMTQAITQANAVAAGLQNNQGAAAELGMDHPLQDRSPILCFHCREQGHISTKCEKPKKELKTAQTSTRVFCSNGKKKIKTQKILSKVLTRLTMSLRLLSMIRVRHNPLLLLFALGSGDWSKEL